jgi:hypothetical protein
MEYTNATSSIISAIVSISLSLYWIYCFLAGCSGRYKGAMVISDEFDIGYVRSVEPATKVGVSNNHPDSKRIKELERKIELLNNKIKQKPKEFKQPKVVTTQKPAKPAKPQVQVKEESSLQKECTLALVTLGFKEKQAKQSAMNFLNNNDIDSVEEFVLKFFSNKDKK